MADQTAYTTPTHDEVTTAFARIRRESPVIHEHPLGDFVLAGEWATTVLRDAERLAAYRAKGITPPLGYYDDAMDKLHLALELLGRQRKADHGEAPVCLAPGSPRSTAMRVLVGAE